MRIIQDEELSRLGKVVYPAPGLSLSHFKDHLIARPTVNKWLFESSPTRDNLPTNTSVWEKICQLFKPAAG
jgi:hypothetical protein